MRQKGNEGRQGGVTHHWLGAEGKLNLLAPRTAQAGDNVGLRNVLDVDLVIVLGVVLEDDALDAIRRAAEPPSLNVVQDRLELGLRARNVRHLTDADAQASPEDATEMRRGMSEAIRLTAALFERDENAEVVLARQHAHTSTRELCRNLVEAAGREAPLGTADVECAYGRVVGGLLGQV